MLKFGLMGLVRLEMCFLNVERIFICKGSHGLHGKVGAWAQVEWHLASLDVSGLT